MMQLGVFLLLSGWDVSPTQIIPSIEFFGIHLYTWVKRGTVRAPLAQKHNLGPVYMEVG